MSSVKREVVDPQDANSLIPVVLATSISLALLYNMTRYYIRTSHMSVINPPTERTDLEAVRSAMRLHGVDSTRSGRVECPLEYDRDEGAYMLRVGIGRGLVSCVMDSGSAHLTVKGSECSWSNCYESEREARRQIQHVRGGSIRRGKHGKFCIERTCPCGRDSNGRWLSDCRDHSYTPSVSARVLRGSGLNTTLSYGSQTNSVQHFEEQVCVMDVRGQENTLGKSMVVYQIFKVDGDTSSNILGMTVTLDRSRDSFLDAFPCRRWSCVLHSRNPTLVLNVNDDEIPAHALRIPFVNLRAEPELQGLSKSDVFFYTCRLRAIGLSSGSGTPKWWRAAEVGEGDPLFPNFVVFDTGTTNSYADAVLGPELRRRLGWREVSSETLHFEMDGGDIISWRFDDMIDPDGVNGRKTSALHCETGRTYDDFKSIFMGSYFIMIGVRMMKGKAWVHDLDAQHLRVWDI